MIDYRVDLLQTDGYWHKPKPDGKCNVCREWLDDYGECPNEHEHD